MKALLPALNSPATTSRKSSSSWQGRPLEGRLVLRRGVETRQGLPQIAQQPPVFGQQLVLISIENAPQHGCPPARGER